MKHWGASAPNQALQDNKQAYRPVTTKVPINQRSDTPEDDATSWRGCSKARSSPQHCFLLCHYDFLSLPASVVTASQAPLLIHHQSSSANHHW